MSTITSEQPAQPEVYGQGPFEQYVRGVLDNGALGDEGYSILEMSHGVQPGGFNEEGRPYPDNNGITFRDEFEQHLRLCYLTWGEPMAGYLSYDEELDLRRNRLIADGVKDPELRDRLHVIRQELMDEPPLDALRQHVGAAYALSAMQRLDELRAAEKRILAALGDLPVDAASMLNKVIPQGEDFSGEALKVAPEHTLDPEGVLAQSEVSWQNLYSETFNPTGAETPIDPILPDLQIILNAGRQYRLFCNLASITIGRHTPDAELLYSDLYAASTEETSHPVPPL